MRHRTNVTGLLEHEDGASMGVLGLHPKVWLKSPNCVQDHAEHERLRRHVARRPAVYVGHAAAQASEPTRLPAGLRHFLDESEKSKVIRPRGHFVPRVVHHAIRLELHGGRVGPNAA